MATNSSKLVGYAVLTPTVQAAAASKTVGYAVLTTHQSIAGSKLVGYAVLGKDTPPPGSEEVTFYVRLRDRFGKLGPPSPRKTVVRIPS